MLQAASLPPRSAARARCRTAAPARGCGLRVVSTAMAFPTPPNDRAWLWARLARVPTSPPEDGLAAEPQELRTFRQRPAAGGAQLTRLVRRFLRPRRHRECRQKCVTAAEEIPGDCKRLVIGTGRGALPVMDQVKHEAERRKIKLSILPTAEAIEELKRHPRGTNAILHVTC